MQIVEKVLIVDKNICIICRNQYLFRCLYCYKNIFWKKDTGKIKCDLLHYIIDAFNLLVINLHFFAYKFLKLKIATTENLSSTLNSNLNTNCKPLNQNMDLYKSSFIASNKEVIGYIVTIEASLEEEPEHEKEGSQIETDLMVVASAPTSPRNNPDENNSLKAKSTSSLKPKLSNRLIKHFVRKTKSKCLESESSINLESDYKQKLEKNKKLSQDSLVPKNPFICDIGTNTSVQTVQQRDSGNKNKSFFRRLISKQSIRPNDSESKAIIQENAGVQTSTFCYGDDRYLQEYSLGACTSKSKISLDNNNSCINIATSFIKFGKNNLDRQLANDLHTVLDFTIELRESQQHLLHILSQYICDNNFQQELLEIVSSHSQIRAEVERRAQLLTNEMWQKQLDICHSQERALQDSLNSLIKQNRQLQNECENLARKNEQLRVGSCLKSTTYPSDCIELMSANNEKLHQKVTAMTSQIELLESELQSVQSENCSMEEQMRDLETQTQNYKMVLHRSETEYKLEKIGLNQQLQKSQVLIAETVEASEVLLDDLDSLRRQMKSFPCSLNWSKLVSRGSNPTDLIHACRACMHEFARELISSQSQIQLKEKENESLRDSNKRLQENLQRSSTELDKIDKKLDMCRIYEQERNEYKQKNHQLEMRLQESQNKFEAIRQEHEQKRLLVKKSNADLHNCDQEMKIKDLEIEKSQTIISNCKAENDLLKTQINGLNHVLSVAGAGDVSRELSAVQKKLNSLQEHYYQVIAEKTFLTEQLNACNLERDALMQYQQTYYQHIQNQQNDMEALNKENQVMKEQLMVDQTTILALQNERKRFLEETNILKSIYQQYKNEVAKVQKLDTAVANMNKETSRLAIIAAFNKQLADKLKDEVQERDNAISKLKSNVEVLSNIQKENAKDKAALCVELTEVCTIKDKLNNTLSLEMQKNLHMDDVKKELEKAKDLQLKAAEEIQRSERIALKELLRDFKGVVSHRDQLLIAHNNSSKQVSELQKIVKSLQKTCSEATSKFNEKDARINELEGQVRKKEQILESTIKKADDDANSYENTLENLYTYTDQMKKEKENLEGSVKYLQNNTQKLHNDLNEARKEEKETKDELFKITKANETMRKTLEDKTALLDATLKENGEFKSEVKRLTDSNKHVIEDFEKNISNYVENERTLRFDLEKSKELISESSNKINFLLQTIEENDKEIKQLKKEGRVLQEQKCNMLETLSDIENYKKLSFETCAAYDKLQEELLNLQSQHEICVQQAHFLSDEMEALQNQICSSLEMHEGDYDFYKSRVEEITRDHKAHKEAVQNNLQILTEKLDALTKNHKEDQEAQEQLSIAHKLLAAKLMNSLRMLIDEKVTRQNAESKACEINQKLNGLRVEKGNLEQRIEFLNQELDDLKRITNDLRNDKQAMQVTLVETRKAYKEAVFKCEALEQELDETKQICQETVQKKQSDEDLQYTNKLILRQEVSEERISQLKQELNKSHNLILKLKKEMAKVQQDFTNLEFQKCELNLRLHETKGKLVTEENLHRELRSQLQHMLSRIFELKKGGFISGHICDELLFMARCESLNLHRTSEHSLPNNSDSKNSTPNTEQPVSSRSFTSN